MHMKKKILSVLLTVMLITVAFTGCTKKKSSKETTKFDVKDINFKTNQELTKDNITLVVWESTGGPDEFIKQAGKYFTELYPNIKIKYENVESVDSAAKIALDGPGGNGPDLLTSAHDTIGKMVVGAHLEPVPESEKDIVAASCNEAALKGSILNNEDGSMVYYGYPVSIETCALFYNKALIKEEEVPKTMEELVTYIESFKKEHKDDNIQPFLFDAGRAYYSVIFTSTPANHLYGENGNDIQSTYMNTEQAVAQMADFTALSKAINQKSGDLDYKHNDALFSAGQLALNISGAWNIRTYEEDGVDFGITSIPALTGTDTPPANFMGIRCMFVSAYSKHKPEAIAFSEFLMTKEMQQLRCELTSAMPARDDVLENIKDEKIKEYMNGLNKQLKYSYPMPNMARASLYWTPFDSAFSNIWNGEVEDIQEELNKANSAAIPKKK